MTGTITTFKSRLEQRTFLLLDAAREALICGRIRHARRQSGLTQDAVARKLGVSDRWYRTWEKKKPPLDRLEDLAAIFNVEGVDARWLQYGDEEGIDANLMARLDAIDAGLAENRAMAQEILRWLRQASGGSEDSDPERGDPDAPAR